MKKVAPSTPARARPIPHRGPRSNAFRYGVALFAIALFTYWPSLGNGFIWDDASYVTANPTLNSVDGLRQMWAEPTSIPQWYPLVHTTFWIEHQLWGDWATGYHAVNALLHACSAALLWRLLARSKIPGAWIAAAIFAVHPVQVESVAWITERKNVLSMALALISLILYLRFDETRAERDENGVRAKREEGDGGRAKRVARPRRASRWIYLASLVTFILALLSKTVVATLPVVAIILLAWKDDRPRWGAWRRRLLSLAPFIVFGCAMAIVTAWIERNHVGADPGTFPELRLSLAQHAIIASRAFWFYASKLIAPIDLTFIYPRWAINAGSPWQWSAAAALIGAFGTMALLAFRGRLRAVRGALAAFAIYVVLLAPAMGWVVVYPMRFSFVADHFQYHATAALIAGLCAGIAIFCARIQFPRVLQSAVAAVVLVALAGLSVRQSQRYVDEVTLWQKTAEQNGHSWLVWTALGNALREAGRYPEAVAAYERGLAEGPDVDQTNWCVGIVRAREGRFAEAERLFRRAFELNPYFAEAYVDAASSILARNGDDVSIMSAEATDEVEGWYRQAISHRPDFARARLAYAEMLRAQSRDDEAMDQLTMATASGDKRVAADAHSQIGALEMRRGKASSGIAHLSAALSLRPEDDEARTNLGFAMLGTGDRAGAAQAFRDVLAHRPGDARAGAGLDIALNRPPPATRP